MGRGVDATHDALYYRAGKLYSPIDVNAEVGPGGAGQGQSRQEDISRDFLTHSILLTVVDFDNLEAVKLILELALGKLDDLYLFWSLCPECVFKHTKNNILKSMGLLILPP